MSEQKSNVRNVALLAILVVLVGLAGARFANLASISFYQGIHPSFVAIYHDNKYYTTAEPLDASTARIGSATFNFDPDDSLAGLPNLQGELTDIQVIRDLTRYVPGDALAHIITTTNSDPQANEPYKRYTWEVDQPDGSTKFYTMDLWLASLDVNVFVKPDTFFWASIFGEQVNSRYRDTEVWIKLETTNEWGNYFDDPLIEQTYFGLGYLELASFEELGEDPGLDVLPKSKWVALDLYTDPEGFPVSLRTPQSLADDIYGSTVNPEYFRNEYFTKLTVSNFGTYGYNILDGSYRSDSVQWRILAHIFVVGEWTVMPDIDRDPDIHDPTEKTGWFNQIVNSINSLLDSPFGRAKIYVALLVLVVVVIIVTNPRLIFDWAYELQRGSEGRETI